VGKKDKPKGYAPGEVERFASARNRIRGERIKGLVSLESGGKVRMTLEDYEAIGAEMQRLRILHHDTVRVMENTATAVRTAVS
jgi:hypothetical protein